MSTARLFVLGTVILFVGGSANKAEAENHGEVNYRPWAVTAHLGTHTPSGFVGIDGERKIRPWLAGSVSFGRGFGATSITDEFNAAALVRLRTWLNPRLNFGAAAGPSYGNYTVFFSEEPDFVENAYWLAGELHVEFQSRKGLLFRFYAGTKALLASDGCENSEGGACRQDISSVNYLGLAGGYAF